VSKVRGIILTSALSCSSSNVITYRIFSSYSLALLPLSPSQQDIQYRKVADAIVPDALSRRPNFALNTILQYDDIIRPIEQYLKNKIIPTDREMRERIQKGASDFLMEDDRLYKKLTGGEIASYIDPLFGEEISWKRCISNLVI